MRGDRRRQPNRSAMRGPQPGRTTLVIMVSPVPGKYELPYLAVPPNQYPIYYSPGYITRLTKMFYVFNSTSLTQPEKTLPQNRRYIFNKIFRNF